MQEELLDELEYIVDNCNDELTDYELKFCRDNIEAIRDGYILSDSELHEAEEIVEKYR